MHLCRVRRSSQLLNWPRGSILTEGSEKRVTVGGRVTEKRVSTWSTRQATSHHSPFMMSDGSVHRPSPFVCILSLCIPHSVVTHCRLHPTHSLTLGWYTYSACLRAHTTVPLAAIMPFIATADTKDMAPNAKQLCLMAKTTINGLRLLQR